MWQVNHAHELHHHLKTWFLILSILNELSKKPTNKFQYSSQTASAAVCRQVHFQSLWIAHLLPTLTTMHYFFIAFNIVFFSLSKLMKWKANNNFKWLKNRALAYSNSRTCSWLSFVDALNSLVVPVFFYRTYSSSLKRINGGLFWFIYEHKYVSLFFRTS